MDRLKKIILPANTGREFRRRQTSDAGTLSNNDWHFRVFVYGIYCRAWLQTYRARYEVLRHIEHGLV